MEEVNSKEEISCPNCETKGSIKKYGFTNKHTQRYRCAYCEKTFTLKEDLPVCKLCGNNKNVIKWGIINSPPSYRHVYKRYYCKEHKTTFHISEKHFLDEAKIVNIFISEGLDGIREFVSEYTRDNPKFYEYVASACLEIIKEYENFSEEEKRSYNYLHKIVKPN